MDTLTVTEFGTFLGRHSERVVVRRKGEVVSEHPFIDLDHILIGCNGVSISSDLIRDCCERGIQITFLSSSGRPYAKVHSPTLNATVHTRREQLLAYADGRGLSLVVAISASKLANQAATLNYFAKYRKAANPALYASLKDAAQAIQSLRDELSAISSGTVDDMRPTILNLEGRAGALYWDAVKALVADRTTFTHREHQGAEEPLNAMLNYGYGILNGQVWSAVVLAGLEPFAGFLHVDRPGKPSLVLDLMEEFRQAAVDRPLLAAIGKGFSVEMERPDGAAQARLTDESRRAVAEKVLERLNTLELHAGKRHPLKAITQMQARAAAAHLRGESQYQPYSLRW